MTERRPHWDDDLIEAVSVAVVRMLYPEVYPSADIHAVIAAVEDWQIERNKGYMGQHELGIIHTITEVEFDAEKAEAAIQRVRSVCDQWHSLIGTIPISEVLRALEGGSDD